jgi:hypothetical protein
VNLPSLLVLADTCLPFTTTVAPGSISPSEDLTVPLTGDCANTVACIHNMPMVNKNKGRSRVLKKMEWNKEKTKG